MARLWSLYRSIALLAGMASLAVTIPVTAQMPAVKTSGSRNIKVLAHLPLDSFGKTADITIDQELSRPYVYTAHRLIPSGIDIISIKDPARPKLIYSWRIENPELHRGAGSLNPIYFKSKGRYYLTNAFQFQQGGPNSDLGAIVWDVTSLPDTSKIRELARIRLPQYPGGIHESFGYKHSNGEALLFTTTQGPYAHIYDIDRLVAGDAQQGLVGRIPQPDSVFSLTRYGRAYHDFYVAYDVATHQDKFYGSGYAGYYIFDVSRLDAPKLLTSVTGTAGVDHAHAFQATPDGRYAIAETEEQYQPLRVFDLKPGLDGTVKNISRPIGAWMPDWRDLPHNVEMRWPYVFVSSYEDGLQVLNMMDPTNPYTVGYYYTCECPHRDGATSGAWGVQIRNADGLIVLSDLVTGFWAFKMDGFDGWNGHQWGMPNISSVQDWDNGPEGAPKPAKVS